MPDHSDHLIISDLHIGSKFCLIDQLQHFLEHLPESAALILNGDVLDRNFPRALPAHAAVFRLLCELSCRRPVVWVRGNHDPMFELPQPQNIQFVPEYSLPGRLLVTHGDDLVDLQPHHELAIILFRTFYRLQQRFGVPQVHVAHYAKRFPTLYRALTARLATNAAARARARGFPAIACGHTHNIEDTVIDGIRYINTGAWTEPPVRALHLSGSAMALEDAT